MLTTCLNSGSSILGEPGNEAIKVLVAEDITNTYASMFHTRKLRQSTCFLVFLKVLHYNIVVKTNCIT